MQNFSKFPRIRTVVSLSYLNTRIYFIQVNRIYKIRRNPAKKRIDQDSSLHGKRDKFTTKKKNPPFNLLKSLKPFLAKILRFFVKDIASDLIDDKSPSFLPVFASSTNLLENFRSIEKWIATFKRLLSLLLG